MPYRNCPRKGSFCYEVDYRWRPVRLMTAEYWGTGKKAAGAAPDTFDLPEERPLLFQTGWGPILEQNLQAEATRIKFEIMDEEKERRASQCGRWCSCLLTGQEVVDTAIPIWVELALDGDRFARLSGDLEVTQTWRIGHCVLGRLRKAAGEGHKKGHKKVRKSKPSRQKRQDVK